MLAPISAPRSREGAMCTPGVTWDQRSSGSRDQDTCLSHGGGETIGVRGGTIGGDARTEEEANKKQRNQKRKRSIQS